MQNYNDVLKSTLYADLSSNILFFGVALIIILLTIILNKLLIKKWCPKRLYALCIIVMLVSTFEAACTCIPKFLDLKENSFITMQGVHVYTIGDSIEYGSYLYGGCAYINVPNGETIELHGTLYIDSFPQMPKAYETVYGNVVYAQHSGQLITFEEINGDQSIVGAAQGTVSVKT